MKLSLLFDGCAPLAARYAVKCSPSLRLDNLNDSATSLHADDAQERCLSLMAYETAHVKEKASLNVGNPARRKAAHMRTS